MVLPTLLTSLIASPYGPTTATTAMPMLPTSDTATTGVAQDVASSHDKDFFFTLPGVWAMRLPRGRGQSSLISVPTKSADSHKYVWQYHAQRLQGVA